MASKSSLTLRYFDGDTDLQVDERENDSLASPPARLPVPTALELAEVEAQRNRVGFISDAVPPSEDALAVFASDRQMHGFRLFLLQNAGVSLYDYCGLPACCLREDLATQLKQIGRDCGVDGVLITQLLGELPKSVKRYSTSTKTSFFDAGKHEKRWAGVYGRKSLRRHHNLAKRELNINTLSSSTPIEISEYIDTLAALHVERWGFDDVASPLGDAVRRDQYRVAGGASTLLVIQSGAEVVAMHWGLVFGGTLLWHTPVINIKFLSYSPLEVLLSAVAKDCEENNLAILDFGHGDEPYKARFGNDSRQLHSLFLPITPLGYLTSFVQRFLPIQLLRASFQNGKATLRRLRDRIARFGVRVTFFKKDPGRPHGIQSEKFRVQRNWVDFVDFCREFGIPPKRYQYERFQNNFHFVSLLDGTEIASYGWVKRTTTEPEFVGEDGKSYALNCDFLFLDFYTYPKFRGRGCYTELLTAASNEYAKGLIYIYCRTDNIPSLRAIRSAGFDSIDVVTVR